MRQASIFIAIFLSFSSSHVDKEKYKTESLGFLDFIAAEEIKSDSLLLHNNVKMKYLKDCKWILDDTGILSREEKDTIIQQLRQPIIDNWRKCLLGSSNDDSSDFLSVAKVKPGVWISIQNYKTKKITSFSAPIFLRNYNACLFYWEEFCSGTCANGQIRFYIKENNKWIMKKEYCNWFSD